MIEQAWKLIKTEDGFTEIMEREIEPYIASCCEEGYYEGSKPGKLHYCIYRPLEQESRGGILLTHGFSEFIAKYTEMIYAFLMAGYTVYVPELRGHGDSVRDVDEPMMVEIDSFRTYIQDVHIFREQFVKEPIDRRILMGHSMGGAIAAFYLETYPEDFERAILSSPMIRPKTNDIPVPLVRIIVRSQLILGKRKHYVFGKSGFDGKGDVDHSSCKSPERFRYTYGLRLHNKKYQTWSASFGWLHAALVVSAKILRNAAKIQAETLVVYAGGDGLVEPAITAEFVKKVPNCTYRCFEESRHEIFNSLEEDRTGFYEEVFGFLQKER